MKTAKHKGTYDFHPGTLPDRIPAYNTKGTEYKRFLPPLRDPKKIDLQMLALSINKVSPGNKANYSGAGLILNDVIIKVNDGIAEWKGVKIRYNDISQLLEQLRQDHMPAVQKPEILSIVHRYNALIKKH